MSMTEDEKYNHARKQMLEIKGFYGHLSVYLLVNTGLLILNLATSPQYLWVFWPMFGWGIGLVSHAISVYAPYKMFGKNWEERKTREIMEKMDAK
jgi:hypothetical protein